MTTTTTGANPGDKKTPAKKAVPKIKCDRCGEDKFVQIERTDPSDGTKLTNCAKCGYIMLSGGKKLERKGRLQSRNTDEAIIAYAETLEKAD